MKDGAPEVTGPSEAKTGAQFVARVEGAIRFECTSLGAGTLLAVCHGGAIRAAMEAFLGLRPQNVLPVAPASLTILRLAANGAHAKLELYNFRPESPELAAR